MDAIQALTLCDKLHVALLIAFASDTQGFVSAKDYWVNDLCFSKNPSQLMFNFDLGALAAALGYPLQSAFEVPLQGTLEGTDQDGNPIVKWALNAEIGKEINGVVVDSVAGAFRTSVSLITPPTNDLYCGDKRTSLVSLVGLATPDDNLVLQVHKNIGGIDYSDTITIKNIALSAIAGLVADVSVAILPQTVDICAPMLRVEGQEFTFRAWVSGADAQWVDSYQWNAPGAQIISGQGTWVLKVKLPSPPQQVQISVEVQALNQPVVAQFQFVPLTLQMAAQMESIMGLLCRMRHEMLINRFFNPLEDPLRDSPDGIISPTELKSIEAATRRVTEIARNLTTLTERAR